MPKNWRFILEDFEVYKSLILGLAMLIPVLLGFHLNLYPQGFCMALGVLFTFLPNLEGRNKHRILGMLTALVLTLLLVLIKSLILPLGNLGLMAFLFFGFLLVTQLAVFGFRGSMVGFSGQIALVMSFALLEFNLSLSEKICYLASGGILYILLAAVFHRIQEPLLVKKHLADVLDSTAELLKIRYLRRYYGQEKPQQEVQLQLHIQKTQDILRELLYREELTPHYQREMSLFLVAVDMYEQALATAGVQKSTFPETPEALRMLAAKNIVHLHALSHAVSKSCALPLELKEDGLFTLAEKSIEDYVKKKGLPAARPAAIYFRTVLEEENEISKQLHLSFRTYEVKTGYITPYPYQKFLIEEDYSFKRLVDSFSWQSQIFKHSLRTAIIMVIGYSVGLSINELKAYWIILTISVILRPQFGLTKKRAGERMVGTLIGAAIISVLVLLRVPPWVYATMGIPSLFLGFAYLQKNYKIAATYITLVILGLHAVLVSNTWEIILLRLADTTVGAGLALLSMYLIFPLKKEKNLDIFFSSTYKALAAYLNEVIRLYVDKTPIDLTYRLHRKKAMVELINLHGMVQMLTEEPKMSPKDILSLKETVIVAQELLDAIASLGTFVQRHKSTPASEALKEFVNGILQHLSSQDHVPTLDNARVRLLDQFKKLEKQRELELTGGFVPISEDMRIKLQEGKILIDHLEYMLSLSKKIRNNRPQKVNGDVSNTL